MQCEIKHDSCHSTEKFIFAGQNLGYRTENATEQSVTGRINSWFSEHKDTTMNDIRKYTQGSKDG